MALFWKVGFSVGVLNLCIVCVCWWMGWSVRLFPWTQFVDLGLILSCVVRWLRGRAVRRSK